MSVHRHHIRHLRVQEHLHARVLKDGIGCPFEALRVTTWNHPLRMHLDPGQVAINIVAQSRPLPLVDHPHPLEHFEDQTANYRCARTFVDKAVKGRTDDRSKKTAGKTIALDEHCARTASSCRHRRTNAGQTRAADQDIRFSRYRHFFAIYKRHDLLVAFFFPYKAYAHSHAACASAQLPPVCHIPYFQSSNGLAVVASGSETRAPTICEACAIIAISR